MSVFDVPRLHFAGTAVTRLPTGPRSGLYDLARNQAMTEDGPYPVDGPVREYHDHLERIGAKGHNFGGNGHFWVDATVRGWERAPGEIDTTDAVVGRHVDMWGHYNDYLATTFNRARVLDVDPASNWTTTLMIGQFCFGRLGRSHDVGYMAVGDVRGMQPPHRQNPRYVCGPEGQPPDVRFSRSVVHQFAVDREEGLEWLDEAEASEAARLLRDRTTGGGADGLLVRFALSNMATPTVEDAPDFWQLRGTIAPWHRDEPRNCPVGRLLSARRTSGPLHSAAVEVTDGHATLDLITAVPVESRSPEPGPGPIHRLGPRLDAGDLELRTRDSGRLVARVPRAAYLGDTDVSGGLVTVPVERGRTDEPLVLTGLRDGGPPVVLLTEEETTVAVDDASLFLEHPDRRTGESHAAEVEIRTYRLGRPAAVPDLRVEQYVNPRALPADPRATAPGARSTDIRTLDLRPGGLDATGPYAASCVVATDPDGRGRLTLRSAAPGAARLLFLPAAEPPPCDPAEPGSAARGYDNDDLLGYWPAMGAMAVRTLPDTWHLDDIPQGDITPELLYREVFAPYELLYSFMKDEIFSLRDACKVATYPRLMWLMCDPRNKDKTFYMPPTRDMTGPQTRLLLKYLRADESGRAAPPAFVPARAREGAITTRQQLYDGLREAATIELAVMMQYLYAAWSIPLYEAGREYVRRGEWSEEQFRLACGDGGETLSNGMRGSLLHVAREEMIHFLVINNIITAMGQPFHLPAIDFATVNSGLRLPLGLCLEGFGLSSLQRFIELEQPHSLRRGLADDPAAANTSAGGGLYPYDSLSDLYEAIKEGIRRVPDLFLVDPGRGGGEHHLFMRESVNAVHPDYQLEVDDVRSALFAIDFVTEHGEGGVIDTTKPDGEAHFDTFLRMSDLLMAGHLKDPGDRRAPWTPAYPVLRNPTLHAGSGAADQVTEPAARSAMVLFNRSYFLMQQLMIQHFGSAADASLRRSKLMNAAIDVMTGMMRPLAELIVTLPSGRPGRTAGPSFELEEQPGFLARPDVARRSIALRFAHLARSAEEQPGLPSRVAELMRYYADFFREFDTRE
ncbi:ferritin-like domain-containing protein [Streptomyces sp. NPDC021622]|uniref:ferritin-like domain-containing protein n=1 Tax=Streptomyces sp. NPDC021622 TaxID=3155013 RepID=UPI0034059EBC